AAKQRPGRRNVIALRKIYTDFTQLVEHGLALDVFSHGFQAHGLANLVDGLDCFQIDRIGDYIAYERAINLDEVERQVLQIRKRTQAAAEIIQCKATAHVSQCPDQMRGTAKIGDRGGLSDLEHQPMWINLALAEQVQGKSDEVFISHRLPRQVDAEIVNLAVCGLRIGNHGKGMLQHPAINARHDVVALRDRQE